MKTMVTHICVFYLLLTRYLEDNGESDEEEKGFNGDKGNVICILLLPLANVLLSIIIAHFTWGIISGRDKVDKGLMRIELTQCLEGSHHPLYKNQWRLAHIQ